MNKPTKDDQGECTGRFANHYQVNTMKLKPLSRMRILPLLLMAALTAGTAFADKPEWAGQGKGGKHEQKENAGGNGGQGGKNVRQARPAQQDVRVGGYFGDQQRVVIREYYGKPSSAGRCPPGLAKKNNGCMPPGQAKKWAVGQPLPREVVYYPVPQSVVTQLGAPPAGHKYVRVAGDILLLAVGSSMVVDAIQDLGRL
jgi:Ni/Co efflux regulator RcnB